MQAPPQPAVADTVNRDGLWPMPPGPPHEEKHFAERAMVRDLVAGAAAGPVVPQAVVLALALAGAGSGLIAAAGLAAAAAGGLAHGLGGWLAARDEAAHYAAERRREEEETVDYADRERWEVAAILHRYGVRGDALRLAVDSICADTRRWVDFMMRFELDLKEPEPRRAAQAGLAGAAGAFLAGLVPVLPFAAGASGGAGMAASAALTALALAGLGWLRARGAGLAPAGGAARAVLLGALAAAAAALLAGLGRG